MTIEELLNLPPDGFESMSDQELEKILAPYFPVVRPKVTEPATNIKQNTIIPKKTSNEDLLNMLLKMKDKMQ